MINIRRAPSATFHARTFLPSLPPPIILNSKNLNVLEIHLRFGPEAFCVPENSSESILLASRLPFSKYTSTPHEDSDYPWKIGLFLLLEESIFFSGGEFQGYRKAS